MEENDSPVDTSELDVTALRSENITAAVGLDGLLLSVLLISDRWLVRHLFGVVNGVLVVEVRHGDG